LKYKTQLSESKIKNIIIIKKVNIICYFDSNYPEYLKNISNPPFVLYVRGTLNNLPKIAVV
jgi:DNA processing protein